MKPMNFTRVSSLTITLLGLTLPAGLAHAQESAGKPTPLFAAGPSLEQRGDLYMARKMFREAIETYRHIEPITAMTPNKMGVAYQQQYDHAEAREYYERAIKANPGFAEAINNLATVYYAQRKYRRATALYKRALKLQPRSATIHINLGMAWLARHNDAEWQRQLQQALDLDPGVLERRGGYGVMIEERNTTERAKFDFCLARLYARSGKTELALQYIRKALECGFKERQKLLEDEDFAALRELPEFAELMSQPPKVL